MVNPNFEVNPNLNHVESLRGVPKNTARTDNNTINRLCWKLADRMADLLTAIADEMQMELPLEVRKRLHQLEAARHEMQLALGILRYWTSDEGKVQFDRTGQPRSAAGPRNPDGTPLKFIEVFVPANDARLTGGSSAERGRTTPQQVIDSAIHRLPNRR